MRMGMMNKKLKVKEWTMERVTEEKTAEGAALGETIGYNTTHWDITYLTKDSKRNIQLKYAEHVHQFTDLLKEAGYSYVDFEDLKKAGAKSVFSV